jgi:cell division protein FtsN
VAAPAQTAATRTAQPATGSYAVQVSSQRSEAEAQAAFRGLQAKYPSQLGGRQALIHKVELGAKGTYYRAMVGPFATANEASELCNGLKAAGGQCLIQRN